MPPSALQLLLLLIIANGAPILARLLLAGRGAWPVDGGLRLADGRPLFGPSKTLRGVLAAVLAAEAAGLALGLAAGLGAALGALAMAADLLSSFAKRRLGIAPSGRAPLLDQVPESLLPLLALQVPLGLDWATILGIVLAFALIDLLLSRLLYRLHIRRRPY